MSSSAAASASAASSALEQLKQIEEEYKIWKKNSPFLYDVMMSHSLEWPTLTVQWLPEKITPEGCDYSIQRLLLGTHTADDEPNFIHIAEVRLPLEDTEIDARAYEKVDDPTATATATAGSGHSSSNGSPAPPPTDVGGYQATYGKVEMVQSIPHSGEVHRARYMPQNANVIATKAPSPDVYIFDRSLHPAKPPMPKESSGSGSGSSTNKNAQPTVSPDYRLLGHEKEGYGLSWNARDAGFLLSGSDDHLICLWDLSSQLQPSSTVSALTTSPLPNQRTGTTTVVQAATIFKAHTDVVEDVAWNPHEGWQFASAGDDKVVMLWDRRIKENQPTHKIEAHSAEVNCLSFNPINPHLLVSGSSDRSVALWDIRHPSAKLHSFEGHVDQVTAVEWSPFSETLLASASADRRVHVWDVTRIGTEQEPEDAEDGPPELLFVHGGHTDKVVDFSWNPHDEWVCASVADDNQLQVWQIAESILQEEGEEDDKVQEEDLE